MVKHARSLKLLVIVAGCAALFFLARSIYSIIFVPKTYSCVFCHLFSDGIKSKIRNYVCSQKLDVLGDHNLCHGLRSEFPAISSVSVSREVMGDPALNIEAHNPVLRINNNFILADNGQFLSRSLFSENQLLRLNKLTIGGDLCDCQNAPSGLKKVASYLSNELFNGFEFNGLSENNIRCSGLDNRISYVVCNANTIPDSNVIGQCRDVVDEIINRNQAGKHRGRGWCLDVRFKNKIIVFAEGGQHEKRRIC